MSFVTGSRYAVAGLHRTNLSETERTRVFVSGTGYRDRVTG